MPAFSYMQTPTAVELNAAGTQAADDVHNASLMNCVDLAGLFRIEVCCHLQSARLRRQRSFVVEARTRPPETIYLVRV